MVSSMFRKKKKKIYLRETITKMKKEQVLVLMIDGAS